jgi:hypothetical protein
MDNAEVVIMKKRTRAKTGEEIDLKTKRMRHDMEEPKAKRLRRDMEE